MAKKLRPKVKSELPSTKKGGSSDFVVLNLSKADNAPKVTEVLTRNRPWVSYGDDNLFPQHMVRLADNSPSHGAFIQAKSNFFAGSGFQFTGDGAEQAEEFIKQVIPDQESYLTQAGTDYAYFNGLYNHIRYDRPGNIASVEAFDFSRVRSGRIGEEKKVTDYWVSWDWKIARNRKELPENQKAYQPFPIPAYNPDERRKAKDGQLMKVQGYFPDKIFYSVPSYVTAIDFIIVSANIGEFDKNNLDNGMFGSYHIHVYEDLSDPEKRKKYEAGINKKFAGKSNAGKIVITWSQSPDQGEPQLNALGSSNLHELLANTSNRADSQIIIAHRMPLALANVKTATGLQSEDQLTRGAVESFQKTSIAPGQMVICSGINEILRYQGIDAKCEIIPLEPIDAINMVSDVLIQASLTQNEIRAKIFGEDELEASEMVDSDKPLNNEE